MSICSCGSCRRAGNTIRGYVDNASYDGSRVVLVGWACAGGIAQSVNVHVYVGGPAGSGSWFTAATANQPSEPAVAGACGVGYGAYRFSIATPFGPEVMMQLGGLKIYVHGISPVGGSNRLLTNSGLFALPGQRATGSGTCGYVPALSNAPYGSGGLSPGHGGPIRPVIVAIGEYFTHSMLSLGTSGIVHAEMQTPGPSGWPTGCPPPPQPGPLPHGDSG